MRRRLDRSGAIQERPAPVEGPSQSMSETSRRRFLQAASVAAGASALWSPALERALAEPARRVHGTIQDVEHVVILMQENRSFDHYFGCLKGVRGYGDPRPLALPSGQSVFHQPVAPGV